jgi:protein-tyrosine phosphatase
MDPPRTPRLTFLHSECSLNRVKLEFFRRLSTGELKSSLVPGKEGALKVRPDGTVLDGHHRLAVLVERGEDIHQLPREIIATRAMKPDLSWIPGPWRGRLAIAARPRGGDWLEDEATGWRGAGLDVVISLLEEQEAAELELAHERDIVESRNVHFISFPIPDRGVPASTSDALSLLRVVTDALERGKNVGLHCRQGIGRSGLLAAGALVTSGVPVEKALDVVSAARGRTVPETPAQLQWIRCLPSKLPVLTT